MKKYTFKYYPNGINKREITILAEDKKKAIEIAKGIVKNTK